MAQVDVAAEPDIRIVRARNRSQAAIDRALWDAAASTALGLLGPIKPPMVLIPAASDRLSRPAPPSPVGRVKSAAHRSTVQTARWAIAGYAAVFGVPSVQGDAMVARGAFREVIANRDAVYLFVNHPSDGGAGRSLASTTTGTLRLEEDRYGLYFEAILADDERGADAYRHVTYGLSTGMSWGSQGACSETRRGVRIFTTIPIWEISVLANPHQPRFSATWVDSRGAARARRARHFQ